MTAKAKNSESETAGVVRGRDIVCFSHDWTGDPLSKTHLMRVLARDNRVLWVNAIPNRMPTASTRDVSRIFNKVKALAAAVREVEPNIFVLNPFALPAYGNSAVVNLNRISLVRQVRKAMSRLGFENVVNMIFNPAAGLIAGEIGERELIYYCVDEYTAFTGVSKGLKQIEEDLFRRADLVIVSAQRLYDSKKQFNTNTHILRHGTDVDHFRKALDSDTAVPGDIAHLPRPIIGFHGLLADWIDFELIRKLAQHFAHGSIVLIGKTTVEGEQKSELLADIPNVHRLGRKTYADLPAYCKAFDVAINPFEINELTLAANPLKVREYLAAGLPVVSTDIPEVRQLENCTVGTDHDDFIAKVDAALRQNKGRHEISDSIAHESWEARVDELRAIIARSDLGK